MERVLRRYLLFLEYDGSCYSGWQWQREVKTIQSVIEDALKSFGCWQGNMGVGGRTDAGVHAWGQAIHVDLNTNLEPGRIVLALNHFLGSEKVRVVGIREVPFSFHARFSAVKRRYEYLFWVNKYPSPIWFNRAWGVFQDLDVALMNQAAVMLLGKHDFSSFRASGCQNSSPIKTVTESLVRVNGAQVIYSIESRSFLYHQVRNIVSCLYRVGTAKWSLAHFHDVMAAKDRKLCAPTAPAYGLYLVRIFYDF